MKGSDKIIVACAFIKAKVFKKRIPLIVSWSLTYRCNCQCKYCGVWQNSSDELSTNQILSLIDQMAEAGTRRIHFTGGEPLLREDIGIILRHCRKKGISTALNSNGSLVAKNIEVLKYLDLLSLSFDGPEDIHNSIRGRNSYQEVMEAVEVAKLNNIKIKFTTVLSKENSNSIVFILNKARELKIIVKFQPATKMILEGKVPNPIALAKEEYGKVIAQLLDEKDKNSYIGNSRSGLQHLSNWPLSSEISCVNSRIVCRLEPDGSLYGCADFKKIDEGINSVHVGFKNAFSNLKTVNCKQCWCASFVELNCLFSFKFNTVLNMIKLI